MIVENYIPDNLIADNNHALAAGTVTVKSGEGELKRGSLLKRDPSNNKFILASTLPVGGIAEAVLAVDVDATSADAVADVYISGDIKEDALIKAEGYTLTEEDRVNLKNAGIYLKAGM